MQKEMTKKEAAEFLGVGVTTINNYVRRGWLTRRERVDRGARRRVIFSADEVRALKKQFERGG